MDRLQPADIERSRSELADLERRFLERVAMTNRCKTGGEIGESHVDFLAGVKNRTLFCPGSATIPIIAGTMPHDETVE